jgi:HAD superfamily hydrolase (TIGR01490 family)
MNLALFDLDHTLVPFDTGMQWTRFLIAKEILPPSAEAQYLGYCQQYVDGSLDIHAMHRADVLPLARYSRPLLARWCREFETKMAGKVPPTMRGLVTQHRMAGDMCAIVTATTRFVAEPFARLFGIEHLVATEAATVNGNPDGVLTGEIAGQPCYREHKLTKVQGWLASQGLGLERFDRSWFYSDSASDLPLLRAVTDPVVVNPDERLRSHALVAHWPVMEPVAA